MMRKWVFFIALIVLLIPALESFAQKEDKVNSSKSYRSKKVFTVKDLLSEAERLSTKDPNSALNVVQDALNQSLAEKDKVNEAHCYLLIGDINQSIQEWNLAVNNYKKAELILSSLPDKDAYKRSIKGLGDSYLKLGNHELALIYFNKMLTLQPTVQERNETQINIAEAHSQMGQNEKALYVLDEEEQGVDIKKDNQKGKIYTRMNDLEKAQDIYSNSINTVQKTTKLPSKNAESILELKEEISDKLKEENRYDEEIQLRNQSINYNLSVNNLKDIPNDKVNLSKALAAVGETEEAIRELNEAILIADTIGSLKEKANALLALAYLYELNGRDDNALDIFKKYSKAVGQAEKESDLRINERTEILKKQKDIEELSKYVVVEQQAETIAKGTVFRQQLIIYGLITILLIILITSYFIYKNAKASKMANQLLALKSLRSQMNPHFIFNALNSVNHFIAYNDERTANKFLTEFSRLMRLVLENSQEDFIPLYKEEEIVSLYLKLEHYRFRDKFDYSIHIDETLNKETIIIPPMLVQPYIENAVWHGLRYKELKGHLSLSIKKENNNLVIAIQDNGIGRENSIQLKTKNQKKHNSSGLKNIQERLFIINKVYKTHFNVTINDLNTDDKTGTQVIIQAPLTNGHESSYN